MNLASHDVYASIVGGLVVEEPALDLPLAMALASALRDRPILPGTVLCGEIGLTGELRPIANVGRRLREAARLGFTRAIVPRQHSRDEPGEDYAELQLVRVATLRDAIVAALAEPIQKQIGVPVAITVGDATR
jgi:DNA repair protein RadA/Sms